MSGSKWNLWREIKETKFFDRSLQWERQENAAKQRKSEKVNLSISFRLCSCLFLCLCSSVKWVSCPLFKEILVHPCNVILSGFSVLHENSILFGRSDLLRFPSLLDPLLLSYILSCSFRFHCWMNPDFPTSRVLRLLLCLASFSLLLILLFLMASLMVIHTESLV